MAKVGIELNIDVTKIDKSKLYQGQKGTYLTMTAFVDLDNKDQYDNNGMIVQKVTKEEQQQGVKGAILGNSKVFWSDANQVQQQAPQQQNGFQSQPQKLPTMAQQEQQFDDDIPF